MGEIYRKNYKKVINKGATNSNAPGELLRVTDGLSSISGNNDILQTGMTIDYIPTPTL